MTCLSNPNASGLPDNSPEAQRRELLDLVEPNQQLFADKEYGRTLKAILQMKPEQYPDFKDRLTKQIAFRTKHKIHKAA